MSNSIDNRVVEMTFENTKFESGIAASLTSLQKLSDTIKKVGAESGLENLEKSANKVNFLGISTAIDKLRAKFGFREADDAFSGIEKGAAKVTLNPIANAIDKLKGKFEFHEADQAFSSIEKSSGKVSFQGLSRALDGLTSQFSILEGAAAVALGNIVSRAATAGANFAKGFTFAPITGGFKEYETQLNAVQTILANTKASGAGLKDVNKALLELNHYADKTIYNFTEMTRNIGTFTAAGVDLDTATASIKGIANLAALSGSNSQQAATAMYQLSQAISSGRVSLQDWNSVVNAGMGGTVFQRALAQTAVQMGVLKDSAVELKGKMKNVTVEGQSFRESIMAAPGEQSWLSKEVLLGTLKQFTGDMTDAELAAQGFTKAQIKAIQAQAKTAEDAATKVKTLSQLFDTAKEAAGSGWAQTWQTIFGDFGEARHLFTGLSDSLNGWIAASANARNAILKDWKELGGRKILIEGIKDAFEALSRIIKPIKNAFRDIFPAKTASDLFFMTAHFRDFIESIKIGPETMEDLRRTFRGFFAVLDIGKQIISGVFDVVKTLFSEIGKGSAGFLDFTGDIGDSLVKLDEWLKSGDRLKTFFSGLSSVLAVPIKFFEHLGHIISGFFSGVGGSGLDNFNSSMSTLVDVTKPGVKIISQFAQALYTLSGLLWAAIAPAIHEIVDIFRDFSHEVANALSQDNFDNVFKIIQTTLIGGIFLAIKKGIGDGFKLNFGAKALDAIKTPLDTLNTSLKNLQTNIKADSLKSIAISIALIATAALSLSFVDPKKLAKSMTAIAAGFGELLGVLALLAKMSGVVVLAPVIGASMVLIAAAVDVLALAVLALSQLNWESLAKGLTGVGVLLGELALASGPIAAAGPRLLLAAPGILILATGLVILSGAMKVFATMNWEEIAKGLVIVAGSLTAIGLASKLMGPSMILIGPGLMGVGAALAIIAGAMKIFGTMDLETIGKGILAIAGSLTAIALATGPMSITLPITAAGLVLVGIALTEMAGAIAIMGSMKLSTIGKGLIGLGGALGILAVGLRFMAGTLPGAAALALVGVGLALIVPSLGILGSMRWSTILKGLAALGLSLGVLAVAGSLAGPALVILGLGVAALGVGVLAVGKGVQLFVKAILLLDSQGSKALATFVAAFVAVAAAIPKIILDFVKGLVGIAGEIVKLLPAVTETAVKITVALLDGLIQALPKIAEAATKLIQAFLKVLNDNAGPIISTALRLILKFVTALGNKAPQLIDAGAKLLVKFLEGITRNIDKIIDAGTKFVIKFIEGVGRKFSDVVEAGVKFAGKFVTGIVDGILGLIDVVMRGIIRFIDGLAKAIDRHAQEIGEAGGRLAVAIIKGIIKGLFGFAKEILDALINPIRDALDELDHIFSGEGEIMYDHGKIMALNFEAGLNTRIANIEEWAMRVSNIVNTALAQVHNPNYGKPPKHAPHDPPAVSGSDPFVSLLSSTTRAFLQTPEIRAAMDSLVKTVIPMFTSSIFAHSKPMVAAGTFLLNGFLRGLTGTQSEINSAVSEMNNRLSTAVQTYKSKIKSQEDAVDRLTEKLKKLKEANDKDEKAIDRVSKAIERHNVVLSKNAHLLSYAQLAQRELNGKLEQGKNDLLALSKEYENVSKQLEKANATLDAAIAARNDARRSYREQYATLPNISLDSAEPLSDYTHTLVAQVDAINTYKDTLDQLLALGLDDTTYKKLLEGGTANQVFANQLLAAGPNAVAAINVLDKQLASSADKLAKTASLKLYQAGVDAADEIINGMDTGLKAKQKKLEGVMAEIAKVMVRAIRNELKIKSPSQVFQEIGKFSTLGMAQGLQNASGFVVKAVSSVATDAVSAMRARMSVLSNVLADAIDYNPTITPILDLSQVQSEANLLAGLTNVVPITAAASYGHALSIGMSQEEIDAARENVLGSRVFKFEQNNYSPKALSEIEIYRQTNNQLAQAKAAIGAQ